MSITTETRKEIERSVRRGLKVLEKPEPVRLSEWAQENFYLSAESSYIEGRWEAYPYQIGIMDCMSNDDIRSVTMRKSARVGYTKMFVAAVGYFAEHKRRNQVIFQPVDDDADDFVKDEIDPMLRDCVAVQRVFPYFNTKSKYNTLSKKVFRGSTLDIRGGKAAKNYRRLSKDVVYYDEVDGFDRDIENEGDPITLGDKRTEGATFPKSIRGSTPKIKGESRIDELYEAADQRFQFHVPCPHCEHKQPLRWGAKDASYGMKWVGDDPNTAAYLCEACGGLFHHEDYVRVWDLGAWVSDDGTWIDQEGYFRDSSGDVVAAPEHVAFHIWTAYSLTGWRKIVAEFLTAKRSGDPGKLKTFVNTTLGEAWEEDTGEKTDAQALMMRREHYAAPAPRGVVAIVASVDTQDDRFEVQYDGYGRGEERWSLGYTRLYGDPSRPLVWDKLAEALRRTFRREDGTIMQVAVATQDHGGHYSDEVNKFSRRMGIRFLIPVKGASQYGKPVVVMPRKKNAKGVYLSEVGTDTAKSVLYQRYLITDPGPGYIHWPVSDEFDRKYFDQVTAEKRKKKIVKGRQLTVWDAGGRRNEATDCSVYSLAAIRIAQQYLGLDLSVAPPPSESNDTKSAAPKQRMRTAKSKYLGR